MPFGGPLSQGEKSLLQYWGSIQAVARIRGNVQGVISMLRTALTRPTGTALGHTLQDIQSLYSRAVQQRNAGANLAAKFEQIRSATPEMASILRDQAVSPDMLGIDISAPGAAVIQATTNYRARIELQVPGPTGPTTPWRSYDFGNTLPTTLGTILDQLTTYASDIATGITTSPTAGTGTASWTGNVELLAY